MPSRRSRQVLAAGLILAAAAVAHALHEHHHHGYLRYR